ncbi:hypothetical protein D5018_07375 [Parashewanella curva]|uniref:Uncharacterized protein n=1 Tax=Parashewanella curva TaxID=2338552 RepID=A0A3L8PZY1_9GAMM|nr:hypothetical protein [Parashewanella curva]RLV60339.1 hypothetical protein D5018_07375 [Parashewanella curva]
MSTLFPSSLSGIPITSLSQSDDRFDLEEIPAEGTDKYHWARLENENLAKMSKIRKFFQFCRPQRNTVSREQIPTLKSIEFTNEELLMFDYEVTSESMSSPSHKREFRERELMMLEAEHKLMVEEFEREKRCFPDIHGPSELSLTPIQPPKKLSAGTAFATAVELMGGENPALWEPEKFVKKIIERTEDDLSWHIGQVFLEKVKAGEPLPIIGFKRTCNEMKSEISRFLKLKEVSDKNKEGLRQFLLQLSELEKNGYSYQDSLKACLVFPLLQALVYNDCKDKSCWKKDIKACAIHRIDKRYREQGFTETASTLDIIELPFDLLFSENHTADEQSLLDVIARHLSAITGIPKTFDYSTKLLIKDFIRHWQKKIYCPSFAPLNDVNLSLGAHTPFVPWGFIKTVKIDHDNGNMSCAFFSYHDLLHEIDIESGACQYSQYFAVLKFYKCGL